MDKFFDDFNFYKKKLNISYFLKIQLVRYL